MKREESRNKYIRETCDKNDKALRCLAEFDTKDNNLNKEDRTVSFGFKRLTDDAIIPTKAHPTDSGYDLYANEDVIIEPGDTAIVKTGIAVELPAGYEAQIRPRSGVTAKTKLRAQLGTIDNGYRGEIGVIVDNIEIPPFTFSNVFKRITTIEDPFVNTVNGSHIKVNKDFADGTYLIRKGDRLAQLVIQRLPETVAVEIDEFSEDSERGGGGFGSTGV